MQVKDEPIWIKIARGELGVKEVKGTAKNNPRIVEYHSKTNLEARTDEVPWCSSFVNWVMWKSGFKRTSSAMARSWLTYGKKCEGFTKYAIVVFKRGAPPSGHVAFAISEEKDHIRVIGGNQSNAVTIARYPKASVLAYRMPSEAELVKPQTIPNKA